MKRTTALFVFIVLGCSPDKKQSENISNDTSKVEFATPKDTTADSANSQVDQQSQSGETENDCVFNNDYKGLTTEWLTKLGKTNFIWREDKNQAFLPLGQDTIIVSQGGCVHFGMLVELRTNDNNHTASDSAFWIAKALSLAAEFQLKHYEQMIKGGKLSKVENRANVVWFEIEDDDDEDNLIYNGIEINTEKRMKVLSLSQYYN